MKLKGSFDAKRLRRGRELNLSPHLMKKHD